jgi:hypothetical protein
MSPTSCRAAPPRDIKPNNNILYYRLSIFIIMLDILILQIILSALVIIAAVLAAVWFLCGLTKKSAAWIVGLAVPCAVAAAFFISLLSA